MTAVYWDTSALIAVFRDEPITSTVRPLLAQCQFRFACVLTYAESLATFNRIEAEDPAASPFIPAARSRFHLEWPTFHVHGFHRRHLTACADVLRSHHLRLRGADAMHLAVARRIDRHLTKHAGLRLSLATNDRDMWDAGKHFGLELALPRPAAA